MHVALHVAPSDGQVNHRTTQSLSEPVRGTMHVALYVAPSNGQVNHRTTEYYIAHIIYS